MPRRCHCAGSRTTSVPALCDPRSGIRPSPEPLCRHCEQSEANHLAASGEMDCFVALLLAMTVGIKLALRTVIGAAFVATVAENADARDFSRVLQPLKNE